ncbi:MAG: protein phosphatase 2C domain-containing protein [Parvibaculaceae bacterium]|nr:protein phosphatase 2C domain-containing protein [Parvibaculaceae bacterium]
MTLRVIEQFSQPGKAGRPNEDRCGHQGAFAWVIDGATGLADAPLMDAPSDAAWLAGAASGLFAEAALSQPHAPLDGIVRSVIETLVRRFEAERLRPPEHRYELPSAAMVLVRETGDRLEAVSFGDCALFLSRPGAKPGEEVQLFSKSRERERREADRLLGDTGRKGEALQSAPVIEFLRRVRNHQNIEGGYWVLGLEPAAAGHMQHFEASLDGAATGLLASDGFAALTLDYERCTPASFLLRAKTDGLEALGSELRHVENVLDPGCRLYPRFKPSDDATALLFELS